ncbi:Tat pathway signal protein [Oxynema aestuarii]|uniref:Tat pathway signal protein n=1 Tax=Oxynema aestuarii TaxID=2874213 RepID=UPI001FEBD87F|nr:Tat pathway signal protein [Oxynema aestuarii]
MQPLSGVLSSILQGNGNTNSEIPTDAARRIRIADQEFIRRNFTNNRTELAQNGSGVESSISRLWGRQKQESVGANVGFGFVQKFQDQYSDAKISGPTLCGIHNVQKVLADQRLTPPDIANLLLPTRSTFDDWGSWGGDTDGSVGRNPNVAFSQYNSLTGRVTSRYELVEPGPKGFGRVEFTVEGRNQPRRTILLTVRF